jgi:hypothetical protein
VLLLKPGKGDLSATLVGKVECKRSALFCAGGVVGAEALFTHLAVYEGVAEATEVTRGLPHFGVHHNRGVEAYHVLTAVNHLTPPKVHQVALKLYAKRAIIIGALEPTVDL